MSNRVSLRIGLLLFAALIAIGTVGYMLTEGWPPWLALYAAVTTLTTLGTERPTTLAGMLFTVVYVIVGVGTSLYVLSALVIFVAEGHFSRGLERRRMEHRIERVRDHFIICGYGRVGRQIALEFAREGEPFVLVDNNLESLREAASQGHLVVAGNPANEDILRHARVDAARGLIAATDNDAENVYVTLTSRVMRPDLFIVARANYPDAEPKLLRAGANRVISPYRVGGQRMAMLALRPLSVEFVDTVLHTDETDLLLEDVQITERSPLAGLSLKEAQSRFMPDVGVLAVKTRAGVSLSPGPDVILSSGDTLAVIGTAAQLAELERAAST